MTYSKNKGFTLIELLVVVSIIALLANLTFMTLNNARKKARDATRKADLRQIRTALDLYYDDNGNYPMVVTQVLSTAGPNWIPGLAPTYIGEVPVDPINDGTTPWNNNGYAYWYDDNAHYGGANYDLVAILEITSDDDRCEVECWKWNDPLRNQPWCQPCAGGANYSRYIFTGR